MSEPTDRVPISDLKDTFLECPVCVEHFNQTDRRPRLLHSCLHAFCTPCLQQLLEKEGKGQITCPLCRQVEKITGTVESLPKDPVRDQLVEYLQMTHERNIPCRDCPDENNAKSRCMECGENLCDDCAKAHKRNRSTRSHRVLSFEELGTDSCESMKTRHFCPSHSDRVLECFCSKCEILCCLLCAVIDHKGHDFRKLDDAARIKIKEIDKMMLNVDKVYSKLTTAKADCEAYIASILKDKDRSVSEINRSHESLANLLRKRQSFLLREVEERSQKLVAIAKKSASKYGDTLAEIKSAQTYFSNAKSKTDEVSLLQTYPSLKRTLSQITRNHSDDIKKLTQKVAFEAVEEENIHKQISQYGVIKDVKKEEGVHNHTNTKEEKNFLHRLHSSLWNIPEISPDCDRDLIEVENKHGVPITVNKRVSVYGQLSKASEATGEVKAAQQEKEFADKVQGIQWYYMEVTAEGDDTLVPYEMELNVKLERAYIKEKRKQWMYQDYVYDFANWVEYPVGDRVDQVEMIRREKIAAAVFDEPHTWDAMAPDKDVYVKLVSEGSTEYVKVQKMFQGSLGTTTGHFLRLDRIQSRTLYQQYHAKKQQLQKQNPGVVVEKTLWHGTQTAATMRICCYGFNRSYCNKDYNAFGEGVHFTSDAGYAARNRYAPADSQGKRYMFMCKVLTGTYTKGEPKIRVPPPKDTNKPEVLYDSVVDDPANPQTYVIFNDTQAYPEYLISFR